MDRDSRGILRALAVVIGGLAATLTVVFVCVRRLAACSAST